MESNARYLLVGVFTLVCIALSIILFSWMNGDDGQDNFTTYKVIFTDSIRGLSLGSEVQYLGVSVGAVTDFRLLSSQPPKVEVSITVDENVQIYSNTKAELQMQGITGLAMIELFPEPGDKIELPADQSEITLQGTGTLFSRLANSTDTITNDLDMVLRKVDRLLSDENLLALQQIMSNLATASHDFDDLTRKSSTLVDDLLATSRQIQQTARQVSRFTTDTEKNLVPRLSSTFGSIEKTSEKLHATLERKELEQLVRSLNAASAQFIVTLGEIETLMEQLQQSPDSFLYQQVEYGLELPR